jgi:UDP-N-acetyl-D-mannosaminuronic acid dehydrogenase
LVRAMGEMKAPKTAAVIGLGYVGLPTAVLLASGGIITTGIDINEKLVDSLETGSYSSKEPGLNQLIDDSRTSGMLNYSLSVPTSDAYIIAVPTPVRPDKSPDMGAVFSAVEAISKVIKGGQLIILESTSPPGSTQAITERIFTLRPDLEEVSDESQSIKFAYCPERVLPGNALYEIANNERLIGGLTDLSAQMAESLYKSFSKGNVILCSNAEAEMAKLVENSYRDVNIAFANEVSRVATTLGVDAEKVISLANRHPRVNILQPGVGVGGHCISVDPWFLVHAAQESTRLISTARELNDNQPKHLAEQITSLISEREFDEVYCLGLTYKPDSDDLRESPSLRLAEWLLELGVESPIHLVDPSINDDQISMLTRRYQSVTNKKPAFSKRALVLLLVDHSEFQNWNLEGLNTIRITGTGQINLPAWRSNDFTV